MLTRLVKAQLTGFVLITALALSIMGLSYIKAPQQVGIGRYDVFLDLADAGGLYTKANVTYRGQEVGVVDGIALRPGGGVRVTLGLDDGVEIPVDSVAQVRSTSVIGEQYVNFLPGKDATGDDVLGEADVIDERRTELPTTTNELLTSVDDLLRSVPQDDLRTTVDELGQAFEDGGEALGRLIDASFELEEEASANLPETIALIESSTRVLATQQELDPSIREYATKLNDFTSQLARSDDDLRAILGSTAPFARQVGTTTASLETELPDLLTDVSLFAPVLDVYRPAIEHILTVLPNAISGHVSAVPPDQRESTPPNPALGIEGENVNLTPYGLNMATFAFKAQVSDPPPCSKGYEDNGNERDPSDITTGVVPPNNYCDVPSDSAQVVRGARNQLCPQDAGKDPFNRNPQSVRRGAMAIECGLVFDEAAVKRDALIYTEAAKRGAATYKGDKTGATPFTAEAAPAGASKTGSTEGVDQESITGNVARLMAPNGDFFLADTLMGAPPASLGDFLSSMVSP